MDSVHSSNGSIWLWVRLGLELNKWMTYSQMKEWIKLKLKNKIAKQKLTVIHETELLHCDYLKSSCCC